MAWRDRPGAPDHTRSSSPTSGSDEMRRRFPAVDLRPDVLFVEDGPILTSAGLAAGFDLCIHLIRRDHGAVVAGAVARLAVVAPVRPGGQAQFIETPLPPESGTSLAGTRTWALRQALEARRLEARTLLTQSE